MSDETYKYILPALVGLLGVIIGLVFNYFSNSFLKSKEVKLRIIEKVFDKRLKAHEDILAIAKSLRTTVSLHTATDGINVDSYPGILHSNEVFTQFKYDFGVIVNSHSHWISIELFRTLNYIQDYIENVSQTLLKKSEVNYPKFAVIVKDDFIGLAAELEFETMKFFDHDLYSVNLKTSKGHHKWPIEYSLERLKKTELLKNHKLIAEIK